MTTPFSIPPSSTPPTSLSRLPRPTSSSSRSSTPTTSTSTTTGRYVTPSSASSPYSSSNSHSTSTSKTRSKNRSRSKSQISQPRILPFPELPLRAQMAAQHSRESSRATSPLSTPPIERLEVTFDQMVSMSRGGSTDGAGYITPSASASGGAGSQGQGNAGSRVSSGSATGTATPTSGGVTGSTSPPISSPLAIAATAFNRSRAFTAPSSATVISPEDTRISPTHNPTVMTLATGASSSVNTNSPSPASRSAPSPVPPALMPRSTATGFVPSSPALPRPGTSLPNPPVTSSTSTSASTSTPSRTNTSAITASLMHHTSLAPPLPTVSVLSSIASTPNQTATAVKHSSVSHIVPSMAQPSTSTTGPTTAVTPFPATQPMGDHLYQSFLKGTCADVRLVVSKWGVCYHVHKMILVQASFFHTLFLGGFSETAPGTRRGRKGKGKGKPEVVTDEPWEGEDVELHFDDPNITRAAFEICLSRLYSPIPHLHFPTALVPTACQPLTPSFPSVTVPELHSLEASVPANSHLVTPRLLLSLLATTTYLGQGPLMREVLAMTLRTVGPSTVGRYLGFAVGDGIGEEEWSGQTEQGITSLHDVAKMIHTDSSYPSSKFDEDEDLVEAALHPVSHSPRHSTDSDTKISVNDTLDSPRHGGVPIPSLNLPSRSNSVRSSAAEDPFSFSSANTRLLPHFYGVVGNKIGEACGCWMARWGVDLLNAELETPSPSYRVWTHRGLPARLIRAILSSDYFFVNDEMERYRIARRVLDIRRAGWDDEMEDSGDLSLAAGTVSGMGMEVTDDGWEEWEEEERELQKVFAEGIHYCHMTFDDLSTIASDIDPNTHLPYAPLPVLQAAHWTAADLRSRVTAHERASGSTAQIAQEDENELGFMFTSSAISSSTRRRRRPAPRSRITSPANPAGSSAWMNRSGSGPPTVSSSPTSSAFDTISALHSSAQATYHPVPSDETHRIGASGLLSMTASALPLSPSGITIQGVPDFGPDLVDPLLMPEPPAGGSGSVKSKNRPPPHGEKNFFGLLGGRMTAAQIEEKWINEGGAFAMSGLGFGDLSSKGAGMKEDRWAKLEPYRFSVEFFDVDKLSEKERFYSTTHFYAGSYFNCYVQMIKRKEKGVQLGIYLHRQSPDEPFPAPSAPRSLASNAAMPQPLNSSLPPLPGGGSGGTGVSGTRAHPISHVGAASISHAVPGSPPSAGQGPGSLGLTTSMNINSTGPGVGAGTTSNSSNSPNSGSGSGGNSGGYLALGPNLAPYIDTRPVTKAFFSISCASALGTALLRFTSGPDCFALSQSWGWKSSALKSEEYLSSPPVSRLAGGGGDGLGGPIDGMEAGGGGSGGPRTEGSLEEGVLAWTGEIPTTSASSTLGGGGCFTGQSSLRATVVVGVV